MTAMFTLVSDHRTFEVLRFRGEERVNAAFRYDALLRGEEPDAELAAALVGNQATLHMDAAGTQRTIEGVIARAAAHESGLRVRLVPSFALLRLRITSRIFQERDVPAIVATVLADANVPIALALTPRRYKVRSYCTQYRESDLAFVLRLCAEEGIFFVVDDDGVVTLLDEPGAYSEMPGDAHLLYRPSEEAQGLRTEEHHVSRFELARSLRVERLHARDYDLLRPHIPLEARAPAANDEAPASGPVLHAYEHDSVDLVPASLGEREALIRLDQYRRNAARGKGTSACARLAPGRVFSLDEHPTASGLYVVASVTHEGRAPDVAGGEPTYQNTFTCAPASVALRPNRPARRLQQVIERATVVGPEGEDLHTDPYGRVKVRFHWDRENRKDEQRSCWIRVAQVWAGAGFGALFTPRVGMEVVVSFFSGDVDQPLIIGCLYNGVSPPPFALPANASVSGLRTRSTPEGGGYHELSFDDTHAKERVTLSSNRDLVVAAGNDHRHDVGNDLRVDVKGAWEDKAGRARTIEAASLSTIVHGASSAQCKGDLSMSAGGRVSEHVGGGMSTHVEGALVLDVRGDRHETVGTADKPAAYSMLAYGAADVTATQTLVVRAMEGITLQCGESVIELRPEGITLRGRSLRLAAAERVELAGKGPSLRLDERAQMTADEIQLFGEEGRLVLGKDARLDGRFVKLNCDDGKPSKADDPKVVVEQKPLRIKLTDHEYGVLRDKRYHVYAGDAFLEGTTSPEGMLDVRIPKDATSVRIAVWVGAYPEGEQRSWTLRSPGEGPIAAALAKLSNLGYFRGEPKGEVLDDAGRSALRAFQHDMKIPETGELDAATVEKLKTADKG